ncbi:hypothetical protein FT670_00150 [Aeromonas jandaei]|nr:hypothetical protein FT670_00150 [Aeromonas jandaei]
MRQPTGSSSAPRYLSLAAHPWPACPCHWPSLCVVQRRRRRLPTPGVQHRPARAPCAERPVPAGPRVRR